MHVCVHGGGWVLCPGPDPRGLLDGVAHVRMGQQHLQVLLRPSLSLPWLLLQQARRLGPGLLLWLSIPPHDD